MEEFKLADPIDLLKSKLDNKKLHKHQIEAVDKLNIYFDFTLDFGREQNGILVMPTGSGKTYTAVNWLLESAVSKGFKVLWLVHRQELIKQTDLTFRKQAPILVRHGFNKLKVIPVSGGHYSMSQASGYDINICGIGSVASDNGMRYLKRMLGIKGREKLIIVIDEAHHAVSPSYRKVVKKISEINPKRLLLGLTATPYRMQKDELGQLRRIFSVNDNIKNGKGTNNGYIYEVSLQELLLAGFLARPVYRKIQTQINGEIEFKLTEEDEKFFERFGELSERLKDQLANSTARNQLIVDEYLKHKEKYGKTLIFAVNRLHCKTLTEAFCQAGISCGYCMSGEPGVQETIEDFKANKFDVLVNVQILTEGSDVPDIQTIFLTRQTNSDSLLMQMIGRGLRGLDAHGTKFAYIIDFHDTWDRFNFWLDPKQLIIDEFGEEIIIEGGEEGEKTNSNNPEENYSMWDLYLRMYNAMIVNISAISHAEIFPMGWYAVVNNDGEDVKVLVYDNQAAGYELISQNAAYLVHNKPSALTVIKKYFDIEVNLPRTDEVQLLLNALYETGEMPLLYTFKQRDEVDSKRIAKELIKLDLKLSEIERKLKEMFDSTPIIREVYKTFYVFRHCVNDSLIKGTDAVEFPVISIDERAEFNIVEDHFNLGELSNEVIEKWFPNGIKPEIRWSNRPLRSRFGICTKHEDGSFVIGINKLLCSPNVEPEVIKYLIYHELLHANGYWNHNHTFRSQEWKYPNSEEYDGFLDELFLRYKIDEIVPPRGRKLIKQNFKQVAPETFRKNPNESISQKTKNLNQNTEDEWETGCYTEWDMEREKEWLNKYSKSHRNKRRVY